MTKAQKLFASRMKIAGKRWRNMGSKQQKKLGPWPRFLKHVLKHGPMSLLLYAAEEHVPEKYRE